MLFFLISFIQHMANDELRVAVGLQMLYPSSLAIVRPVIRASFKFVVGGRKHEAECVLDILPFKTDKDKSS